MPRELSDKKVVLGVTGSIAAYKACDIVRLLITSGATVKVIITRNAEHFITATTLATLSQNRIYNDMFENPSGWAPEHVNLARWADVVLIAPATANIIGKARCGIADDLLSSTILSATCMVIYAPAMNERMYFNPAVKDNIEILKSRGSLFVGPEKGFLADGESGEGRMSEPGKIVEYLAETIAKRKR